MGAEIHISLATDRYDDMGLAPFLGRDFHYEITRGAIWKDRPFLNDFETKLLEAPYEELFEDENEIESIHPSDLENVMTKVKDFLYHNQESLPFEIMIDYDRMDNEGQSCKLMINNSHCWIRGDSFYHEVTDKVRIVSYPNEASEVDLWVDIADKIEIDGRVYYLRKVTRFEKFKESIDNVIDFCRHAESIGDRIYWIYYH